MAQTLAISELRTGAVCILSVRGRIDSTNAEQLLDRLKSALSAGEKALVLDLRDVAYLTSAAFRALLVATDEAERNAARFVLCSVMGQVHESSCCSPSSPRLPSPSRPSLSRSWARHCSSRRRSSSPPGCR